eukprot:GILI01011623.1.p1 GENE.GILI01011623.1~~GILI01011623.1.p1  ORF type:complete len:765 (+),score=123.07 GILI01011623.1:202-2496(+)
MASFPLSGASPMLRQAQRPGAPNPVHHPLSSKDWWIKFLKPGYTKEQYAEALERLSKLDEVAMEEGDLSGMTESVFFEIHPRYDRLEEIARGSYGYVAGAYDTKHRDKLRKRFGVGLGKAPKPPITSVAPTSENHQPSSANSRRHSLVPSTAQSGTTSHHITPPHPISIAVPASPSNSAKVVVDPSPCSDSVMEHFKQNTASTIILPRDATATPPDEDFVYVASPEVINRMPKIIKTKREVESDDNADDHSDGSRSVSRSSSYEGGMGEPVGSNRFGGQHSATTSEGGVGPNAITAAPATSFAMPAHFDPYTYGQTPLMFGESPSAAIFNSAISTLNPVETESDWEPDEDEMFDPTNDPSEEGMPMKEEDILHEIDRVCAVAIKKINIFTPDDDPIVQANKALCACRELGFLCFVDQRNQKSVMAAETIWIPIRVPKGSILSKESIQRTKESFESVYVIMPKMERTLKQYLESDEPPILGVRMLLLFRIIAGVAYMHISGFIHRDLKPENMLLSPTYNIKIMDFGQGRDFDLKGTSFITRVGLCTLLYASPETLRLADNMQTDKFSLQDAHSADMWSVGCIAAEMITRKPIFNATRDGPLYQLDAIVGVRGTKSPFIQSHLQIVSPAAKKQDCDNLDNEIDSKRFFSVEKEIEEHDWGTEETKHILELEKQLIQQLLSMDPVVRPTALQALKHPFFENLADFGTAEIIENLEALERNKRVFETEAVDRVAQDLSNARDYIWALFLNKNPDVRAFVDELNKDKGK